MGLNFDCDRPAKNDFTASTLNYWREKGANGDLKFFEMTSANTLVPYGDERAFPQSRFDVYICYEGQVWYAVELKERNIPHDYSLTVTEGAYMNPEKRELIQPLKDKGYTPIWCELYVDGIIRIWNLSTIDVNTLQTKESRIKKINIDPNSHKQQQLRYLLPISAATTYKRYENQ